MQHSSATHEQQALEHARTSPIRCAVLTVSDTRTIETDQSGARILAMLPEGGCEASRREIVPDEPERIRSAIEAWLADPAIDAVLTTGGTGIARRDTTIEVVRSLLTAELDGFGELFRMLSWREVGAAAMLSRAAAGLVARDPDQGGDTFIFSMPGSVNAVETAMGHLIVPQLAHLVWERRK